MMRSAGADNASDASAFSGKKIFNTQNVNFPVDESSLTSTSLSSQPSTKFSTGIYRSSLKHQPVSIATSTSGPSAAAALRPHAPSSSSSFSLSCTSSSLLLSEHSILTDIAHRLGTYKLHQQKASESNATTPTLDTNLETTQSRGLALKPGNSNKYNTIAVRKEAELLLNFMSKAPAPSSSSSLGKEPITSPRLNLPELELTLDTTRATRKVSHEDDLVYNADSNPERCHSHTQCTTNAITNTASITNQNHTSATTCHTPDKGFPSVISPSFSFESKRQPQPRHRDVEVNKKPFSVTAHNTVGISHKRKSDKTFDLICPSLSLNLSLKRHSPVSLPTTNNNHCHMHMPPSQLFARPINAAISSCEYGELDAIASTLASNFLQSFLTAIHWRTKAWMKSLSVALSHRYQHGLRENNNSSKKKDRDGTKFQKQLQQTLKQSHEARVISALSRAKDSIVVHDVRTTFLVLEQQDLGVDSRADASQEEKKEDFRSRTHAHATPSFKKMKLHRGSISSSASTSSRPYDITHALMLETTCSISTSTMEQMTIAFTTPGTLRGTFCSSSNCNAKLQAMTLDLNTHALAQAMEEHSRRVVLAATKEYMIGTPKHICTIHDTVQVQTEVKKRQMSIVSSSSDSGGSVNGNQMTHIGYASGSDLDHGKCPSLSSDSSHSYRIDTPDVQAEEYASDVDVSIERENYTSYFVREKDTKGDNLSAKTKSVAISGAEENSSGCPLVTPIATETAHIALDLLQGLTNGTNDDSDKKSPRLPLDRVSGGIGIQTRKRSSLNEERQNLQLTFLNPRRVSPSADVDTQEEEQVQTQVIKIRQAQSPSQDSGAANHDDSFASPVPTPSKVMDSGNGMTTAHRELLIPPSLVSPVGQGSSSSYNLRRGSGLEQVSAPPMPALFENGRCH